MYGIIYAAINKINGNLYIGKTTKTLEQRKNKHLYCSEKLGLEYHFYRAIRKDGWKNFDWKIIDQAASKEEYNDLETYYIDFFDSYNNGYNMNLGGHYSNMGHPHTEEEKKKISISLIGKKHPHYKKHPRCTKETKKKISIANKGRKRKQEFKDHMKEVHSKKVICIETKEIYPSAKEANKKYDVKVNIAKACRDNKYTIKGYHWMFLEEYNQEGFTPIINIHHNAKMVLCIETEQSYFSVAEAEHKTGVSKDCISKVCTGKNLTAGGYHWKYI
jgi:group I intron endonuclease